MSGLAARPAVAAGGGALRRDHVDGMAAMLLLMLCVLWGAQQVAIKLALAAGMPPLLQGGIRSAGAALLVVAWQARGGMASLRALRPNGSLKAGLLLGLLFGGEFLLIYPGMALTTAARGVLFLYTTPLFVALGAHVLVPGERLSLRQGLGLLCAFGGIGVAVADGLGAHASAHGASIAGDALVLLGAMLWAATTLTIRLSPSLGRSSAALVLLYQLGGSAPLLLVASLVMGETLGPGALGVVPMGAVFYQTVIVAFASYLVWFWLVGHYPAGRISAFTFLTPIFGMAAAALVLKEPVSFSLAAALGLVVVGLWLVNRRSAGAGMRGGRHDDGC